MAEQFQKRNVEFAEGAAALDIDDHFAFAGGEQIERDMVVGKDMMLHRQGRGEALVNLRIQLVRIG